MCVYDWLFRFRKQAEEDYPDKEEKKDERFVNADFVEHNCCVSFVCQERKATIILIEDFSTKFILRLSTTSDLSDLKTM